MAAIPTRHQKKPRGGTGKGAEAHPYTLQAEAHRGHCYALCHNLKGNLNLEGLRLVQLGGGVKVLLLFKGGGCFCTLDKYHVVLLCSVVGGWGLQTGWGTAVCTSEVGWPVQAEEGAR